MKTKLICFILACLLSVPLTACNSDQSSTDDDFQTVFQTDAYVPSPDYTDHADVLSINGKNITYEEYRYYYLNIKEKYDRGDDAYWNSHDYNSEIKAEALRYLSRQYAIEELASEYGISLDEDDLEELEKTLKSNKDEFESESEYNAYLDYLHLTDRSNYRLASVYSLEQKLFEYLSSEESDFVIHYAESLVDKFVSSQVFRGDWIILYNDYGDDKNENRSLAELIIENVNNGEKFATLKAQYSEDSKTSSNPDGQLMFKGEYDKEIEDAVLSLESGKVSNVIETPYGFIVATRYELDEKYKEENYHTVIVPYYQQSMFEIMLKKLIEKQTVIYFDTYDGLNVNTVK